MPKRSLSQSFSISEAIRTAWNITKGNLGFIILLETITLVIFIVSEMPQRWVKQDQAGLIVSILAYIIHIIVQLGWINISLKYIKKKKVILKDLINQLAKTPQYIIAGILYALIYLAGLILLVIPGIIWSIKFQYFGYIILEEKIGPIEALKKSAQITRGHKWQLFLFGLVLLAVNMLGLLCFIIGVFVTIPLSMLANAYVYKKLSS